MLTPTTGHMRTAPILLRAHITPGTVPNHSPLTPLVQLFLAHSRTGHFSVGGGSTPHTDFLAALASGRVAETARAFYVFVAARFGAPFQVVVAVYVNVHFEEDVLFVDFFRAEAFYVFSAEDFFAAAALHAGNLFDFTVFDVGFEVVSQTHFAEAVFALQAEELTFGALLTTDITLLQVFYVTWLQQ